MKTARILDLAIAIGAGSPAVRPARGLDDRPACKGAVLRCFAPDASRPYSGTPGLTVTQP